MAKNAIMEERNEFVTSLSGRNQITLRKAHFLAPTLTSTNGPIHKLPPEAFSPTQNSLVNLPLKVEFQGCKNPTNEWKNWVLRMRPVHQETWERTGIYEAIMNSTYTIKVDEKIILGFAQKWFPKTSSFVLPWAEASITLEDVFVLGGYSVLGDSLFPSLEPESERIHQKLMEARRELNRSKWKKVTHTLWIKHFTGGATDIEHEAFLVYWLSRHVFPVVPDVMGRHVHKMAILLARGTRLALAPMVLSSLYRELRILKEAITESTSNGTRNGGAKIILFSQMQLVQIWAWERFPTLRPGPKNRRGEPIMAQWDNVKGFNVPDVGLAIEAAAESFLWRPYMNPNLYKEREQLVLDCSNDMGENLDILVKFFRVSELVGLESVEQYLPHRVALQFGFDQDLPGHVDPPKQHPESAWGNYTRPVTDKTLYIPPRRCNLVVTTRYFEWWIRSKTEAVEKKPKIESFEDGYGLVPPGFLPR